MSQVSVAHSCDRNGDMLDDKDIVEDEEVCDDIEVDDAESIHEVSLLLLQLISF